MFCVHAGANSNKTICTDITIADATMTIFHIKISYSGKRDSHRNYTHALLKALPVYNTLHVWVSACMYVARHNFFDRRNEIEYAQ